MKICAIICEYNPFHNGHLYQIQEAKRLSSADAILCVMSGNFVQRGDAAIMDKFTRAKHAILAGADAVIELPTVFATSNAEIFAKGGVKLLSSIPAVSTLCFGAEKADKLAFLLAGKMLNDEPKEVSNRIKEHIASGMSYAKARAQAFAGFISEDLLCSPNNILGLEYTRALLACDSNIEILPIERIGSGYSDKNLNANFSSATAIRAALDKGENFSKNLPDFVEADLPKKISSQLEILEKYTLLERTTEEISRVCDCTEGLENAFQKAAKSPLPLCDNLTSSRYTSSRIRRIALQNLLNIEESLIRECLQSDLYLRLLAVNKERTDVLSALSESRYPLLARAHDDDPLIGAAKSSYQKDLFAENIHTLLYPQTNEKNIFI